MQIDPWILAFSAITVAVTIWMGFWSAKKSKTASDFFVAGRSVSVGWNASAISGEYLSAASFMGVAGMVMSSGYDALWYPVCYACGYLFLLLFIAGPLRRFGAYTIPDFAEGRFDSPLFRKIAVIFVLFIGFFYTMPQMKGAGTTLGYIFPGLPYWTGVVLVGAVITLNVALGGMKGITLIQAFQYWAKMFAISVPVFVLMSVYGHYGNQLGKNSSRSGGLGISESALTGSVAFTPYTPGFKFYSDSLQKARARRSNPIHQIGRFFESIFQKNAGAGSAKGPLSLEQVAYVLTLFAHGEVYLSANCRPSDQWQDEYSFSWTGKQPLEERSLELEKKFGELLGKHGVALFRGDGAGWYLLKTNELAEAQSRITAGTGRPLDEKILQEAVKDWPDATLQAALGISPYSPPPNIERVKERTLGVAMGDARRLQAAIAKTPATIGDLLREYWRHCDASVFISKGIQAGQPAAEFSMLQSFQTPSAFLNQVEAGLRRQGIVMAALPGQAVVLVTEGEIATLPAPGGLRKGLPAKAPADATWLNPFGPLTTKAVSAANAARRWEFSAANRSKLVDFRGEPPISGLEAMLDSAEDLVEKVGSRKGGKGGLARASQLADWTNMPPNTSRGIGGGGLPMLTTLNEFGLLLEKPVWVATNLPRPRLPIGGSFQSRDQFLNYLETFFLTNGVRVDRSGDTIKAVAAADWESYQKNPAAVEFVPNRIYSMRLGPHEEKLPDGTTVTRHVEPRLLVREYGELLGKRALMPANLPTNGVDFNPSFAVMLAHEATVAMEAALKASGVSIIPAGDKEVWAVATAELPRYQLKPIDPRPYSLLYTYSLIIALVCGTAGLPHILVRFYTNPDGVAAKRTTMWVMILIGVFYLFPPVFGVMGRNLMPELYNGLAGVKGTDGVVLKLPKLLNERFGVLGSVMSGVTCAGAFAAFMSTFSGLLVSMTGALAHDVYGRILRPKSTPDERMRMFKLCAVIVGAGAMLLGFLVEGFEINKMVGWAFAIAATSYFPLLFLSTWWRGITMRGAATGMLVGGTLSLLAIASTMLADQAPWAGGLKAWYAVNPLWRILAEQPAIWGLPLALGLMYVVSKRTAHDIPEDIRMKMLVLHAPEKLGLKQEYIQEHQAGH